MDEARIRVEGRAQPLTIRINGRHPNFSLETDRISAKANAALPPLIEDLLEVASVVFAADSSIDRGRDTRPNMGQSWRRRFSFEIPVREPNIWSRTDVTRALTDAVSFLTDDQVDFTFKERENVELRQAYLEFDPQGPSFSAKEVVLFSGGLDSFAGALEVL